MEEEITLDLRDFVQILKKRIKLILFITILSTVVSVILSFYIIKPTYEASTTIVIGKANAGSGDKTKTDYNYNDIMMYQKLVKTYAEIGKSNSVAEKAAAKLDGITPAQIQSSVTVTPQADTQIVVFKAQNNNAQQAYLILDAVCNAFMQEAKRIYPDQNIEIMDEAKVPSNPIKPKKLLNIAIAFFIGLMASVGLTFVLEYMDTTIKTEQDVSKYLDLPVIGMIPKSIGK